MSSSIVSGHAAATASWASPRRASFQFPSALSAARITSSRSAFPCTASAPTSARRSRTSDGHGPLKLSPATTIASTCSRSMSRSTASSAGRFPWMSLIAATRTFARLAREPEPRPRADEIERRAVRAHELARRRTEVAFPNTRDRSRELGLERWHIRGRERRRDDIVRLLEELIRDLDLVRACSEAHQRVDEPLQRVLRVDDLGRRPALERVRLVVDDECVLPFAPKDVEAAANDDVVVLERERPLGTSACKPGHPCG